MTYEMCGATDVRRRKPTAGQRMTEMRDDASYLCDSCGQEIVVPLDISAGATQEYVEDCPVCCHPNIVHVEVDEDGEARVWAESEQ
jgi:hypothetical protein